MRFKQWTYLQSVKWIYVCFHWFDKFDNCYLMLYQGWINLL